MVGLWMARAALAAAVTLPIAGGAAGSLGRRRACVALSWLAPACAGVAAVAVAALGVPARSGTAWAGLVATPVSVVLVVLVTGVGAVVQSFSARYLQADPSKHRFSAWVGVVVGAMGVVAASATLATLAVGWVLAGVAFLRVLSCRADLPGVARCRRAMGRALLIGDGCLLVAAGVVWAEVGNLALRPGSLVSGARDLGVGHDVVAALVAVAALSRCAQGLFWRWLPATVSAPTPACALLHAGVVNGGGILLVRLGALGAWGPAMAVVFAAAGTTSVAGAVVMAIQPDVKGQLAFSTMSQMGFMLAECAVGAYGAAIVHLVGHGAYKASLFFSSGSTVPRPGRVARAGVEQRSGAEGRSLAAMVTVAVVAAAAVPGVVVGDGAVLSVFAAVTACSLSFEFLVGRQRRVGDWRNLAWPALFVALSACYGGLVAVLGRFLSAGLSQVGGNLGAWWLLALLVAGAAAAAARRSRRWGPGLRAWALEAAASVGRDGESALSVSAGRRADRAARSATEPAAA